MLGNAGKRVIEVGVDYNIVNFHKKKPLDIKPRDEYIRGFVKENTLQRQGLQSKNMKRLNRSGSYSQRRYSQPHYNSSDRSQLSSKRSFQEVYNEGIWNPQGNVIPKHYGFKQKPFK